MTLLALDRAVLSEQRSRKLRNSRGPMIPKTDQTAQSDQRFENAREFGALSGQKLTSRHPKLTSGTAQQPNPARLRRDSEQSRSHRPRRSAAAMSAVPLIEAVRRAGGAIAAPGRSASAVCSRAAA